MRTDMRYIATAFAVLLLAGFSFAGEPTTEPATKPAGILSKRIPELRFDGVALADVLGFLSDVNGTTFTADWNALRKQNVDVTTSVTMRVKDLTLGQILDAIAIHLNKDGEVIYTVDKDNTIEFTTKAAIGK